MEGREGGGGGGALPTEVVGWLAAGAVGTAGITVDGRLDSAGSGAVGVWVGATKSTISIGWGPELDAVGVPTLGPGTGLAVSGAPSMTITSDTGLLRGLGGRGMSRLLGEADTVCARFGAGLAFSIR